MYSVHVTLHKCVERHLSRNLEARKLVSHVIGALSRAKWGPGTEGADYFHVCAKQHTKIGETG